MSPLDQPRPRRYLVLALLLVGAVSGLAVWALHTIEAGQESRSLAIVERVRRSAAQVADSVTAEVLATMREHLRVAAAAGDAIAATATLDALPAVHRVLHLDAQGAAQPLLQAPLVPLPTPIGEALQAARELEFVQRDPQRALAAYTALQDQDPAASAAGRIACLLRLGRVGEARAVWLAAREPPPTLHWGEALALEDRLVAAGAPPAPLSALLALWRDAAPGTGLRRLQEELTARIAARAAEGDAIEQAAWQGLLLAADHDAALAESATVRLLARWHGAPGEDAWLPIEQGLLTAVPAPGGGVFLVLCAHEALRAAATARLAGDAALLALRETARQLPGAAAAAGPLAVPAPTPWGDTWTLTLPGLSGDGDSPPAPVPVERLLVLVAVGGVLIALVLLGLSARRDLAWLQLRRTFVAQVSHELRTPLTLLRMHAELLSQGYAVDPVERERCHQVLLTETERLTFLVENILRYSALERGSWRHEPEAIDLGALCEQVLAVQAPRLQRDGFTVATDIPTDLPLVLGDPESLGQVLHNLIDNAIKYSPERKELRLALRLALRHEQQRVLLSISDAGIGIAAADRPRIFDGFFRGDSPAVREQRGVGLGLALVHAIVVLHGGRIQVESRPGAGSTFTIVLPTLPEAA